MPVHLERRGKRYMIVEPGGRVLGRAKSKRSGEGAVRLRNAIYFSHGAWQPMGRRKMRG